MTTSELLQIQLIYDSVVDGFDSIASKVSEVETKLDSLSTSTTKASSSTQNTSNVFKTVGNVMSTVGDTVAGVSSKLLYLGGSLTAATYPVKQFGEDALDSFLTAEKSWASMSKAMDQDISTLKADFSSFSQALSESYGTPLNDVIDTITEFSKAGITNRDVLESLSETAEKVSINFDTDLATSTDLVRQLMQQWGWTADDVTVGLSAINEIGDNTATSELELASAFTRVSPAARQAGVDFRELGGYIAALQGRGYAAAESGNSLRTILQYMSQDTDKLSSTLKVLGINMTEAELNALNGEQKMQILAKGYSTFREQVGMTDTQIQEWSETVGDTESITSGATEKMNEFANSAGQMVRLRQFPKLIALLDDMANSMDDSTESSSEYAKALQSVTISNEDLVNTFNQKVNNVMDSAPYKYEQLTQKMNNMKIEMGSVIYDAIIPFMDSFSNLMTSFNNLDPHIKSFIAQVGLIAVAAGPVLIALSTIGQAFAFLSQSLGGIIAPLAGITGAGMGAILLIGSAIAGAIYWLQKFGERIKTDFIDQIKPEVIEKILNVFTKLWEGIQSGFSTITNATDGAEESLLGRFSDGLRQLAELINNIDWDQVANGAKVVGQVLGVIGGIIFTVIKVLGFLLTSIIFIVGTSVKSIREFVDFIVSVWNIIQGIDNSIRNMLANLGANISAWFSNLVSSVSQFINLILSTFFNFELNFVTSIILTMINLINSIINTWNSILAYLINILISIENYIKGGFDFILSIVSNISIQIYNIISFYWNLILLFFNFIKDKIWTPVSEAFQKMWNVISTKVSDIYNKVSDTFNNIKTTITNALSGAWNWGADFLQNFINGINSKVKSLTNKVNAVAQQIKNILGFSLPEEGPLSNADTYMPDFMDLMSQTLQKSSPRLFSVASEIASMLSDSLSNVSLGNQLNINSNGLASIGNSITPYSSISTNQNVTQVVNNYEFKPGITIASESEIREFQRYLDKIKKTEDTRNNKQ